MADAALVKKLRLEKYPHRLLLQNRSPLPELEGIAFDSQIYRLPYDLVLTFVFSLDEMAASVQQTASENWLSEDGLLYLCYPKKGNKTYPVYIGRDDIFPYLKVDLDTGLVPGTRLKFNSMAAFNDVFTVIGLKQLSEKAYKKLTIP
ncbi:MAG: hypothetical protein EOM08_06460 [Clostridia bacterium]|nr:hypothetical protein [Clostridia bacterium]NCC76061.1 hypothetical protein [Clostridia bacterium]